jgi:hypothetical protein
VFIVVVYFIKNDNGENEISHTAAEGAIET